MADSRVRAWRPGVPGIAEVFHARFTDHAYPMHTHDVWTLLILDTGAIRYDLDRHDHGAAGPTVTLLPPHVAHDGRAATRDGFRKRVLYLDDSVLDDALIGRAVDTPELRDPLLRDAVHLLHRSLRHPSDALEAETRLVLVRERLRRHLLRDRAAGPRPAGPRLAQALRDLLDSRLTAGITLREAGRALDAHPGHLVRTFSQVYGLPPHLYLTGRRVEHARRLLLSGAQPATVAAEVGFHDQAHMTRHFRRHLGVTPARYARAA